MKKKSRKKTHFTIAAKYQIFRINQRTEMSTMKNILMKNQQGQKSEDILCLGIGQTDVPKMVYTS